MIYTANNRVFLLFFYYFFKYKQEIYNFPSNIKINYYFHLSGSDLFCDKNIIILSELKKEF